MAKFELKFIDSVSNESFIKVKKENYIDEELKLYNPNGFICLTGFDSLENVEFEIHLDKSTAIKFAKTLRTEINKITESEVNNG